MEQPVWMTNIGDITFSKIVTCAMLEMTSRQYNQQHRYETIPLLLRDFYVAKINSFALQYNIVFLEAYRVHADTKAFMPASNLVELSAKVQREGHYTEIIARALRGFSACWTVLVGISAQHDDIPMQVHELSALPIYRPSQSIVETFSISSFVSEQ